MDPPISDPTPTPPGRDLPPQIPPQIPPRLTPTSVITNKPAKLIIDNQNINIPHRTSVDTFLSNLKRNFKRYGFQLGRVDLYNIAFSKKLWNSPKPASSTALVQNQEDLIVTLHWIQIDREDCDIEIEYQLMEYAILKNPPFVVVLASADSDYVEMVQKLRSRYHTEVYLSAARVSAQSVARENCFVEWDLLAGEPKDFSPLSHPYFTPTARPILEGLDQDEPNRTLVLLDAESTDVVPFQSASSGADPDSHLQRINSFLLSRKKKAHGIEAFVYEKEATPTKARTELTMDFLTESPLAAGIKLHVIKPLVSKKIEKRTPDMGYVDVRMGKMMYYWGLSKLPSAPIMIISKDVRLVRPVKVMKAFGFNVEVATDMNDAVVRNAFEEIDGVSVISWA